MGWASHRRGHGSLAFSQRRRLLVEQVSRKHEHASLVASPPHRRHSAAILMSPLSSIWQLFEFIFGEKNRREDDMWDPQVILY
jgi:hypothetical protein